MQWLVEQGDTGGSVGAARCNVNGVLKVPSAGVNGDVVAFCAAMVAIGTM